ncbi:MAG: hypothetical protein FJW35_02720 [Acidobacteria bacterium]|nr:hypothetical protein [Acidobacteriota bacterium]
MNGAAAAAAAAIAQAIKASGAIVRVDPDQFLRILARQEDPLLVMATGGLFRKNYQYLTGYKGFVFFTKSPAALHVPGSAEVVQARTIWIPS